MKFKFRVDAGNRIGLGHLMRCMSIAQILKRNNAKSIFFLKQCDEKILNVLEREGYEYKVLQNDEMFLNYLEHTDRVILDGYHFDSQYELQIKERAFRVVTIDDLQHRHFYSDVVINHTPGINALLYKKEAYTEIYSGLNYCLLREEIRRSDRRDQAPQKLQNGMLCLGGEDPLNFTVEMSQEILDDGEKGRFLDIIVGPAYRHLDLLRQLGERYTAKMKIHVDVRVNSLICLIQNADFAVVSASTVALECIFLRIPLYLIKTAENQAANYNYLVAQGVACPFSEITSYSYDIGVAMLQEQRSAFTEDIESNIIAILFK